MYSKELAYDLHIKLGLDVYAPSGMRLAIVYKGGRWCCWLSLADSGALWHLAADLVHSVHNAPSLVSQVRPRFVSSKVFDGQRVSMREHWKPETSRVGVGTCTYSAGTLRVTGHLHRNQLPAFTECMEAMVADAVPVVALDFQRCTYLSSMFIGQLVDSILQAKEQGKRVQVLVSPEIGSFFATAHLNQLFEYTIARSGTVGSGQHAAVAQ